MKILKWLSVADRFYKIYLDRQLAPFGINSSQHMFLTKICGSPGILQDSLLDIFYVHPSNIVRTISALEKQGMITRAPHDKDKRTWELFPTERGLDLVEGIQSACERTENITARHERDRSDAFDQAFDVGREEYYRGTSYQSKGRGI